MHLRKRLNPREGEKAALIHSFCHSFLSLPVFSLRWHISMKGTSWKVKACHGQSTGFYFKGGYFKASSRIFFFRKDSISFFNLLYSFHPFVFFSNLLSKDKNKVTLCCGLQYSGMSSKKMLCLVLVLLRTRYWLHIQILKPFFSLSDILSCLTKFTFSDSFQCGGLAGIITIKFWRSNVTQWGFSPCNQGICKWWVQMISKKCIKCERRCALTHFCSVMSQCFTHLDCLSLGIQFPAAPCLDKAPHDLHAY